MSGGGSSLQNSNGPNYKRIVNIYSVNDIKQKRKSHAQDRIILNNPSLIAKNNSPEADRRGGNSSSVEMVSLP